MSKLITNLFLKGEGSQQQAEVVPMEDDGEIAWRGVRHTYILESNRTGMIL
jgi:hypothetical protein